MNNKSVNLLIFVAGIGTGVLLTLQYAKNKYERIAREEIESVKAVFKNKKKNNCDFKQSEEVRVDIADYAGLLKKEGYDPCPEKGENTKERRLIHRMENPYLIAPEEFGEFDDYEPISLTYYADQILADENDEIIEDVENCIGFESLNHFGDYEEDAVFVRNDERRCDYEILKDNRKYSDVVLTMPRFNMEE